MYSVEISLYPEVAEITFRDDDGNISKKQILRYREVRIIYKGDKALNIAAVSIILDNGVVTFTDNEYRYVDVLSYLDQRCYCG